MTSVIVLVVDAPIERADIPGLCSRVCRVLDGSDAEQVVCDVGAFPHPDAVVIDALARLQLAAGRRGKALELRRASSELRALLELMGLGDVVTFVDEPLAR